KTIVNLYQLGFVTPAIDPRNFGVDQQNGIQRQTPIFGCLDIEAINLLSPPRTRHPPGISNTLTAPGKKRIIATIPRQVGSKDTFGGRACLGDELRTGAEGNIESIDTFQPIAERAVE